MAFMYYPLCEKTVNSTNNFAPSPIVTHGSLPVLWGALWGVGLMDNLTYLTIKQNDGQWKGLISQPEFYLFFHTYLAIQII